MSRQVAKKRAAKSSSAGRSSGAGFRQGEPYRVLTPAQSKLLQMQGSAGNRAVQSFIGRGQPLPHHVLGEMESRFATELSDVQIHDNPQANASAESLGAKAYACGEHIVFGERFAPHSESAKRLLVHELAHVIQQRRGGPPPGSDANTFSEQAADRAVDAFANSSGPVAVSGSTSVGIARAETEEEELKKRAALEEYRKRGGKVEEVPPQKKQPPGAALGKFATREDKAASRQRAMESMGASSEDPTPINTRSWKEQGREEYQGALRRLAHEKDPKIIPEPVRANLEKQLKAMDELMKTGKYDETKHRLKLPEGYVLGHYEGAEGDPSTPAREGFDYENARVITLEQNQAEEKLRREKAKLESAKPASKEKKAPAKATPPIIRKKAAPAPGQPPVAPQKAPVAGKPSAFIGPAPESAQATVGKPGIAEVPTAPPKQPAPTSKVIPSLHSPALGEAQVARARNVGTALGLGLGLLSGYALDKYKGWMEEALASAPPIEINQQSLQDYLKNSASSMQVIDLLAKDIAGFSKKVREKAQHAIDTASLAMIAIALASPNVRIGTLDRLGEDLGTLADELLTVRDGAEAALQLEGDARKGISAANDLADYILKKKPSALNVLVWDQLVKLGFSIEQIMKIHDNLRSYAARLQRVLDDLHGLRDAAKEMHLQANSFASKLNGLYWSEVLQAAKSAQQRQP